MLTKCIAPWKSTKESSRDEVGNLTDKLINEVHKTLMLKITMRVQDGPTFPSMFGENGSKTMKRTVYCDRCFMWHNFFYMIEMITCLKEICRKNIISYEERIVTRFKSLGNWVSLWVNYHQVYWNQLCRWSLFCYLRTQKFNSLNITPAWQNRIVSVITCWQ